MAQTSLDAATITYLNNVRLVAKYMLLLLGKHFAHPEKTTDRESSEYTFLDEQLQKLLVVDLTEHQIPVPRLPFRNLYVSEKQIRLSDDLTQRDVLEDMRDFIGWIDKKLYRHEKEQGNYAPPTLDEIGNYIASENSSTPVKNRMLLDAGTNWSDITIRFSDSNHVVIIVNGKAGASAHSYDSMGFADARSGQANRAWMFLYGLAQRNGRHTWGDGDAAYTIKKQKQNLSGGLRDFFGIADDPFSRYDTANGYEIKINLEVVGAE